MTKLQIVKNGIAVADNGNSYFIKKPFFSIRNYRHLAGKSLVIGFVGLRGSGKSVGATRTLIIDYILRGYRVWSNMPIVFTQIVKGKEFERRSEDIEKVKMLDLDDDYRDGVIYFDEANVEFFEAYRHMSKDNLSGAYMMQQLRHRGLSAIWTAQSESHVDTRLRFQTDIFIKCVDVSMMPGHRNCGSGELSLWKVYDYSGIVTQKPPVKGFVSPFYESIVWNKPWWNCYDTRTIQRKEVREKKDDTDWIIDKLVQDLRINGGKLYKRDWPLWKALPDAIKKQIGWRLPEYGIRASRDLRSYELVSGLV